jgi:GT2 family glycosyltransferase
MQPLSVVIPSYNAAATLPACLSALTAELDQTGDEVIVVDSSSFPLPQSLKRLFPTVRWEIQPSRLFPGAARNLGFRLACMDRIAFLDADIEVQQGWRQAVDRLPTDLIAGGGPVCPARPATLWGLTRYWIEFGRFSERNFPVKSWNIPSCNMVWSRLAFTDTEGFPENFRSADDLLFNFRNMKQRQRNFVLLRELRVTHPADCTRDAAQRHLSSLGYWSAKARLAGVRPHPGKGALSLAPLYLYRLAQVWKRCLLDAGAREAGVLTFPLARGLTWWCEGFAQGMRMTNVECRMTNVE